jgi:hypothetical protein
MIKQDECGDCSDKSACQSVLGKEFSRKSGVLTLKTTRAPAGTNLRVRKNNDGVCTP